MDNNPDLVQAMNKVVRTADQAIRSAASGRPDYQIQADVINNLVKVVLQLDERIVALEEQLSSND